MAGIETKAKRDRLVKRREPYWAKIQKGGSVGYRTTSGTWIGRYRLEDGKQAYQALTLPSHLAVNEYDAAVSEARAWMSSLMAGAKPTGNTVAVAAEEYLASLRINKGPRAAADAAARVKRCILPVFKSKRLDKITTAEIRRWHHALLPDGLTGDALRKAKASANRNLATLKALLNFGHSEGMCISSLAWDRVKSFEKVERARPDALDPEQIEALIRACNGAFRDLVISGALTGARYGELRALRTKDLDQRSKTLHIREGKTGARDVPLTPPVFDHFSRLAKDKLPEAYLLTRDDGKPWAHSDQDKLMREAVKRAKLPRSVVFYTLRHSYISQAIGTGLDVFSIGAITGTSIAMIERYYGKLLKEQVREKMTRNPVIMLA